MKYFIYILILLNLFTMGWSYGAYLKNNRRISDTQAQINKIDYMVSNLWAVEHCDLFIKKKTVLIKKLKDLEAALAME